MCVCGQCQAGCCVCGRCVLCVCGRCQAGCCVCGVAQLWLGSVKSLSWGVFLSEFLKNTSHLRWIEPFLVETRLDCKTRLTVLPLFTLKWWEKDIRLLRELRGKIIFPSEEKSKYVRYSTGHHKMAVLVLPSLFLLLCDGALWCADLAQSVFTSICLHSDNCMLKPLLYSGTNQSPIQCLVHSLQLSD